MKLEGIHHVTSITADAAGNVAFYVGLLGLRMVKKTVNQDDPTVYHLFYADDDGSPGADMTFFEYRGARRGRAGAGMVHTVAFRVADDEALGFWQRRLEGAGVATECEDASLRFSDPEGICLQLVVEDVPDTPLLASHPEVPGRYAIQGIAGVRAYATDPDASARLLSGVFGCKPQAGRAHAWEVRGNERGGWYALDPAPSVPGFGGAGTVHHVALCIADGDYDAWLRLLEDARIASSGPVDRHYFRSIYLREPSHVLLELATAGPGFDVDEPRETLGRNLVLPPRLEPFRAQIESVLTPLPDDVGLALPGDS